MIGFGFAVAYDKDQIALEAIKTIGALGGVAVGLYYYGLNKGQKKKKDDDE
jgi:hypothetical protein